MVLLLQAIKVGRCKDKEHLGHRGAFAPLYVATPVSSSTIKLALQFYALLEVEAKAQESFPHIYLHGNCPWAPCAHRAQPLPAPPSFVDRIFIESPISAGALSTHSAYADAFVLCSCSPESGHEERCLKMQ